ncbi:hypothetical protein BGX34_003278, partial [Mortierella sp. NVP85]
MTTKGSLTVTGALIQDVRGLSPPNKQLLKQRGTEGEPANLFRETNKKLITMASVVSRMRQPSDGVVPNSPPVTNIPDAQPQKQ